MSNFTRTRVLIVDDEQEMVKLISLMLRGENVEIFTAPGGKIGVQKALQEDPDIIITDLMMPELDGFTLMHTVLEKAPHIAIVVSTAFGSMNTAIKALKLGAFDFLVKPLEPKAVRETVAKAAKRQLARKQETWQQLIANGLSTARNPVHIAQKFLSLTASALGAEHGMFWWADPSQSPLFFTPTDRILQQPMINWATGVHLTPTDTKKSAGQIASSGLPGDESMPLTSMIGVPLLTHQGTHGVLLLGDNIPHYFDQTDLSFLESLTSFTALALDNARTYANLKASNQKLSTLQSINALTYNAELPLNRVLRLAVEGIRQNLNYPAVFICLPDETNQALTIRAAAGHLDRFLYRRGDTPSRTIIFPLTDTNNPFCQTFLGKQIQDLSLPACSDALTKARAADIAQALADQQIARCMVLPLWRGEKVIGLLTIGFTHPDPISFEEQKLLSTLGNQIAMVVTNASLYYAEQQGRREMEALYRAGLVITSTLSHAEVLKTIIEQIVDLTLIESCIIGRWDQLRNAETIELYLQRTANGWIEKEIPGTAYLLSDRPLVKEALEQKHLKVVRHNDPNIPASEQAWMDSQTARLRLIMPLIIRDTSIGVIELITSQSDRNLTEHIIRTTQGLAAQASIALENARLHEAEIKRIEQEMDLAQRIQISLLPHDPPDIPGLSIAARSASARLVGGDFYRYLALDNNKFGVIVGDVSGKGVPSALFMAITITALDTHVRRHSHPDEILQKLNQVLYPRMQANHMNTGLLVVIFDIEHSTLEVANAGMIAPLFKQNHQFNWIDVFGLPVGTAQEPSYLPQTFALTCNTTLIIVSDGIIEAKNKAGKIFGFQKFEESAGLLSPTATSRQILDHLWQDVQTHIGGADPHDDMTMVVIQTTHL